MVDNPQTSDEWVLSQGYPNPDAYELEGELVTQGWKLSLGDESVRDEYYKLVDRAFDKGWTPYLLDGQQEVMLGAKLVKELCERDETIAQDLGYADGLVRQLVLRLFRVAYKLSQGKEQDRTAYYRLLDAAFNKGWRPQLLTEYQKDNFSGELYAEMIEKYEALQAKVPK